MKLTRYSTLEKRCKKKEISPKFNSTLELEDLDLLVMSEGDVGRVLFPGLSIYLHGNRLGEKDSHLMGLTHSVGLTEANLHLGNVETREHTEHLE